MHRHHGIYFLATFALVFLCFEAQKTFAQSANLVEARKYDWETNGGDFAMADRPKAEQFYLQYLAENPNSAQKAEAYSRLGAMYAFSPNTKKNEPPDAEKARKYFTQCLAVEPRRIGRATIRARSMMASLPGPQINRFKAQEGVYEWLLEVDQKFIEANLLPDESATTPEASARLVTQLVEYVKDVQSETADNLIKEVLAGYTPETYLDELKSRFPDTPLARQAQAALDQRGAGPRSADGRSTSTMQSREAGFRIVGAGITGASLLLPESGRNKSTLDFKSSEADMVKAFDWSKRQALAYARDEGDPVGPWIEGGEPGRESFCMRDMSHQAMGAHALGLSKHVHNMMHRFAENIAEERDWCSYWGMTRQNKPRRVDYKDTAKFWYCLPANFDVLDCCYRMYLWTGNIDYVTDPVFLNFYDRSVTDYVKRWALGVDELTTRPRLLNVRGIYDPNDKYQPNRGIPGYDEQTKGYTAGLDLVSKEYAAFLAYSHIQEIRGNAESAQEFLQKAINLKSMVLTRFWNDKEQAFAARLDADHQPEGRGGAVMLLHGLLDDPAKMQSALGNNNSHETLHILGEHDQANDRMKEIALGTRARREYPETSYSWMGALVNGTMGIHIEAPSPLSAWVQGYWVETIVSTRSGLGEKIGWAELRDLPVRANRIVVRHDGEQKTTLSNIHGPALIWQAMFDGAHETLLVNGRPMKSTIETLQTGSQASSVRVTVGAGGMVAVELPK